MIFPKGSSSLVNRRLLANAACLLLLESFLVFTSATNSCCMDRPLNLRQHFDHAMDRPDHHSLNLYPCLLLKTWLLFAVGVVLAFPSGKSEFRYGQLVWSDVWNYVLDRDGLVFDGILNHTCPSGPVLGVFYS